MTQNKGKIWILLGLLLIVAALCLVACNFYDQHRAQQSATLAVTVLAQQLPTAPTETDTEEDAGTPSQEDTAPMPDYLLSPHMEMPVETVDGVDYIGILYIPALELTLPVISQWSYPDLKIAPCRYSGSAYLDDLVLCAHNYSSHFGNLKNLQPGDSVTFTDMDGNVFSYQVTELETLLPNATDALTRGEWDLTLFTCTIGGRTRVLVRCSRI